MNTKDILTSHSLHLLIALVITCTYSQAQSQSQTQTLSPIDSLGNKIESPNQSTESQNLDVNEIRIRGRRDGVEVKRASGSIDYYSDKGGLYSSDDESLGSHSTLRTWRFGN